MKIVILIQQIILEKFAYGKWFMWEMEVYTFTFKMVNKMKNSGSERVAGLTPPLRMQLIVFIIHWQWLQCYGGDYGDDYSDDNNGYIDGELWLWCPWIWIAIVVTMRMVMVMMVTITTVMVSMLMMTMVMAIMTMLIIIKVANVIDDDDSDDDLWMNGFLACLFFLYRFSLHLVINATKFAMQPH